MGLGNWWKAGRLSLAGCFRRPPPCSPGLFLDWLSRSSCQLQKPWNLLTSLSMWALFLPVQVDV